MGIDWEQKKRGFKMVYFILLIIYFAVLFMLYFNQTAVLYNGANNFESDTAVHIRMAVVDGYYHSLASFVYLFFSKIVRFEAALMLIATLLAFLTVGAIPLTAKLVHEVLKRSGVELYDPLIWVIAFAGNILIAFTLKRPIARIISAIRVRICGTIPLIRLCDSSRFLQ